MRIDILERKVCILQWIKDNKSKAYICRELKCRPGTLNTYLLKMNIVYKGNKGNKNIRGWGTGNYLSAYYYLGTNKFINSHILKLKLIYEHIKEEKCERCGGTTWLDTKIPLELHHKDGDCYNNKLDNLEIICPNCHALEDNNSGASNKRNLCRKV
jgi:hypothetical protein